ncbi:single-stranded-DNA-specific exonuclease RecJ [Candidatus Hoaglandella endobia]|uniref:Single-stranded-DNA-specific exonuclease RecJ n=1 Tax=Candidatus Hoaglandella endobia TaxID=1778263 RepID=A0A143WUB5_9ENTR|nr:single-stranded-DNA-specific exonuclease RecJ [Candidatus Hoaglandella endobia]CUX97337.1 Single-stranded-DNA-specific exonuclease RecJ [Candidatus Hoaglandella endobia]
MKIKTELRRRPLRDITVLAQADCPPLLKRLYAQRGVKSVGELERSLHGLLAYQNLLGIEQAVNLLINALVDQRKFLVVGDFDVDGATSTALTVLALRQLGAQAVDFLVPNRFEDGYGLSPRLVDQAIRRGAQLIITVDNGISSYAGVALAHENGIPVLITDHHLPGDTLPAADAIVNPNLSGCTFASKALAGVGVAFYLMLALRARLSTQGWFEQQGISSPKLAELLDLVALGTVADLVPLDTNNRILVYQGLNRIRAGSCRPGICALAEVANRDRISLCTSDLSFSLVPRLNAAGRLNDMSLGVTLLLTDNLPQARILAAKLNALNQIRREIEQVMEREAMVLCQDMVRIQSPMPFGLAIYHAEWHQGVVGILASRIKERFHRPVIAFAKAGDGILKGSGRSVTGLHIRDLLESLAKLHPGLILQFGGHAMAAGLMIEQSKFELFRQHFVELINEWLDPTLLKSVIWSDGELTSQELSIATAKLLQAGGPWGQGFPDPLFDGRFYVLYQRLVGKKHLKLRLKPLTGGPMLDGIAFNIDPSLWPDHNIHTIEVVYRIEVNKFRSNYNLQLVIQHLWPL